MVRSQNPKLKKQKKRHGANTTKSRSVNAGSNPSQRNVSNTKDGRSESFRLDLLLSGLHHDR